MSSYVQLPTANCTYLYSFGTAADNVTYDGPSLSLDLNDYTVHFNASAGLPPTPFYLQV